MSDDVKAAAERLIALGEFYERLLTHRRYSDDLLLVARFALEAADRQAALAAELERLRAALQLHAGRFSGHEAGCGYWSQSTSSSSPSEDHCSGRCRVTRAALNPAPAVGADASEAGAPLT